MMHYRRTKKVAGTINITKDICLCLNGGAEENEDWHLTRVIVRVDCPHCLAILKIAEHDHISMEEAASKYIQTRIEKDEQEYLKNLDIPLNV